MRHALRDLNLWAFFGCLQWPRGQTWRASHALTRWLCLMLFRYITRPVWDWYQERHA